MIRVEGPDTTAAIKRARHHEALRATWMTAGAARRSAPVAVVAVRGEHREPDARAGARRHI